MLVPCLPDVPWPGCSVSPQDDKSPVPASLDAGWCYPQEDNWTLFEQLMANAGTDWAAGGDAATLGSSGSDLTSVEQAEPETLVVDSKATHVNTALVASIKEPRPSCAQERAQQVIGLAHYLARLGTRAAVPLPDYVQLSHEAHPMETGEQVLDLPVSGLASLHTTHHAGSLEPAAEQLVWGADSPELGTIQDLVGSLRVRPAKSQSSEPGQQPAGGTAAAPVAERPMSQRLKRQHTRQRSDSEGASEAGRHERAPGQEPLEDPSPTEACPDQVQAAARGAMATNSLRELRKSLSGATSITEMGAPGLHRDAGPQSLSPPALPCNAQDAGPAVPDQHEAEPPASPGLDDFDVLDWELGTASDPDSEPESRGRVKTRSGKRGRKGCGKARRSNGIAANMSLESLEAGGYFDMTMQEASRKMHVGVTTLKKVCRMHNIKRWPYRRRSYIHKLTRKAGSGDGRASANERAAERAREASGALGPAAPHLPVLDTLHREGSGLQGAELITTNILLPSLEQCPSSCPKYEPTSGASLQDSPPLTFT